MVTFGKVFTTSRIPLTTYHATRCIHYTHHTSDPLGDSFLVLYEYKVERKTKSVLYYWQGCQSSIVPQHIHV